ncbi:hypothetical protein [Streptococcus gallolyticus]|uniref:hypothetical protein n=1 Tax=Streptococcus gallolyticus TaxID=315405 RepID=UPI0034A280A5
MALFEDPNPDWYGTYSDYHPKVTRDKTNKELEEEIEQLKAEIDELKKSIADLKHIVISISR